MLFTSYGFIGFITAVFIIYYLFPKRYQWCFLLGASYVFYFLASPSYLIFIGTTTVTVWLLGRRIETLRLRQEAFFKEKKGQLSREEKKAFKSQFKKQQWRWLLGGLLFNLGILAVLKYTNFAIANFNGFLSMVGSTHQLSYVNLVLPMGISFYTFQALGYLIDVYRGTCRAEKNLFRLALFVSFFPQLVQGPISRYSDLAASLYAPHRFDARTVSYGLYRILWGYFKKLVIADRILVAVNAIIQHPETYQGGFVLVGMLFYAFELYADFTGGIDITIGIAQTMGITVKENFIRPYFSKNIKEYWNRWHISMGTWFTDYIFYPISVCKPMLKLSTFSRKHFGDVIGKRVPVYLSAFAVWLATGVWHGASWNFIAWGLTNYVVIMVSQELQPLYRRFHARFHLKEKAGYGVFEVIRTILLMSCIRMFDCYRNVPLTFRMFANMFTQFKLSDLTADAFLGLGLSAADYALLFVSLLVVLSVSLAQEKLEAAAKHSATGNVDASAAHSASGSTQAAAMHSVSGSTETAAKHFASGSTQAAATYSVSGSAEATAESSTVRGVRDWIFAAPAAWKYIIFAALVIAVIVFGAYGIGYDQTQFIYNQF
ncbi:MAG: MBOAT family protein [Lachnospiraceae bacterium]|nr:MBOAT family protein [Lachnospiraceae bacterium]